MVRSLEDCEEDVARKQKALLLVKEEAEHLADAAEAIKDLVSEALSEDSG